MTMRDPSLINIHIFLSWGLCQLMTDQHHLPSMLTVKQWSVKRGKASELWTYDNKVMNTLAGEVIRLWCLCFSCEQGSTLKRINFQKQGSTLYRKNLLPEMKGSMYMKARRKFKQLFSYTLTEKFTKCIQPIPLYNSVPREKLVFRHVKTDQHMYLKNLHSLSYDSLC